MLAEPIARRYTHRVASFTRPSARDHGRSAGPGKPHSFVIRCFSLIPTLPKAYVDLRARSGLGTNPMTGIRMVLHSRRSPSTDAMPADMNRLLCKPGSSRGEVMYAILNRTANYGQRARDRVPRRCGPDQSTNRRQIVDKRKHREGPCFHFAAEAQCNPKVANRGHGGPNGVDD